MLNSKVDALDHHAEMHQQDIDRIHSRFDVLDGRLDTMFTTLLTALATKEDIQTLHARMNTLTNAVIGMFVALTVAIIGGVVSAVLTVIFT